ncbi:MAG: hypothetical protein JW741_29045 [Sedimentisphaerales bacterium]|nr:hypothetical protein [Sedimentisphaerales bacterium]
MKARDNPFTVERLHAIRYRTAETTFEEILSRLDEMNYRAAIVGPEGSGKTTLLGNLQDALAQQGFKTWMFFVNDTAPLDGPGCRKLLTDVAPDEIVLLDGADAVGRSSWSLFRHRTANHAAGLIITSHRPGLLPTLVKCATTPALLAEIVNELKPPGRTLAPSFLDDLYNRHAGNLRDCLRELYDLYARF